MTLQVPCQGQDREKAGRSAPVTPPAPVVFHHLESFVDFGKKEQPAKAPMQELVD